MGIGSRQLEFPLAGMVHAPGRGDGRTLDRHGETEYVEMTCRSMLNWVEGKRLTDFYSVNPYRGCEFGCVYCYARYTHEFLDRDAPEDFERRVYVKTNAAEVFVHDVKRAPRLASGIHLGSATDPYQPAEARFGLTRRILEKLLPLRGIPITLASKSTLVARDLDLLVLLARRHEVKVVLTCVTLDEGLRQSLEPAATPTERRLETLAALADRGVATGMLLAPVIPAINDGEDDLLVLAKRAREAGARSLISQILFLPAASKRRFFPWLKAHRPDLSSAYSRDYQAGREWTGPGRAELLARIARVRRAAGFPDE